MKQIIKENLSNEMAQAAIKIFETSHVSLKIFWIICLLATNSLCFYLVIASFLSYFEYEVNTTSRNVFETPTPFPKVNRLTFARLKSKSISFVVFFFAQKNFKYQKFTLTF